MEVLHEPPTTSSFTPLSEHQSQTPSSFYSSNPVLYHHAPNTKLIILEYDSISSTPLSKLADSPSINGTVTNGDISHESSPEITVPGVDVWVTSDKFILFRSSLSTGVSIPYPTISLHAIQSHAPSPSTAPTQGLYMQLDTSDGFDDHDPSGTISLTIIPSLPSPASEAVVPHTPSSSDPLASQDPTPSPIQALFAALSACANLHPDPASPDSADGTAMDGSYDYSSIATGDEGMVTGLPPPMPGSGGWITAENMGEFFDEEGNWVGGGELGPGAGSVRGRDEEGAGVSADGEGEDEEGKRRRVE